MIGVILNKLTKNYTYKKQGIEPHDEWREIRVGDIVEFASQFSEGIRYKVEELDTTNRTARIRLLEAQKNTNGTEAYTVGQNMLRKVE